MSMERDKEEFFSHVALVFHSSTALVFNALLFLNVYVTLIVTLYFSRYLITSNFMALNI